MKRFSIIGAAGYIAPKHMEAIKRTGNKIKIAYDINDSVGIIDSYFPDSEFCCSFEHYDRIMDNFIIKKTPIDYVTICSPNYIHDAHIRHSLRSGCDVICEKPLILDPENFSSLNNAEKESGKKVSTVLQLRLHKSIQKLKNKLIKNKILKIYDVELTYITSRGSWYHQSWKGDFKKSGGIVANIGIHFFDMLYYLFGEVRKSRVNFLNEKKGAGFLEYQNANVKWFLSIDQVDIPEHIKDKGQRSYRSIILNGKEIEFSGGFSDLHVKCYENILKGLGCGLEDARSTVELLKNINTSKQEGLKGEYHPFLNIT